MFGHLSGVSEWAERAFVKEREGGPLAWGNGLGLQGWPAPHTEASRAGFGQVFRCLDADVNFLQRFSVGNVESAGYAAKGGDCWYPVGPSGVIPEVRTEARGRSWGNFCRAPSWSLSSHRITNLDQCLVLSR